VRVASSHLVGVVCIVLIVLILIVVVNVCVCRRLLRRKQRHQPPSSHHERDAGCTDTIISSVELTNHCSSPPNCYTTSTTATTPNIEPSAAAGGDGCHGDDDMWRLPATVYMNSPADACVNFYRPRHSVPGDCDSDQQLYDTIDDVYLKPITEQEEAGCTDTDP